MVSSEALLPHANFLRVSMFFLHIVRQQMAISLVRRMHPFLGSLFLYDASVSSRAGFSFCRCFFLDQHRPFLHLSEFHWSPLATTTGVRSSTRQNVFLEAFGFFISRIGGILPAGSEAAASFSPQSGNALAPASISLFFFVHLSPELLLPPTGLNFF